MVTMWSPRAEAGGGEHLIFLGPTITVAEVATTLYYVGAWVTTGAISSVSGGGSDPQDTFVMEHRHDLTDALVVDTSGILRDAAKVYGVPDEAFVGFARRLRQQRHVLQFLLGKSFNFGHLAKIHNVFRTASSANQTREL